MDKKRSGSLLQSGFTRQVSAKTKQASNDAVASSARVDPEPSVPPRLSKADIRALTIENPWSEYVEPSHFNSKTKAVHVWRCKECSAVPGSKPAGERLLFRSHYDFTEHAGSKQHQRAMENKVFAASMQNAREQAAFNHMQAVESDSGKLCVLVAWMISNGISLRLFPTVCSLCCSPDLGCH
jgi:hypothetical protein